MKNLDFFIDPFSEKVWLKSSLALWIKGNRTSVMEIDAFSSAFGEISVLRYGKNKILWIA